MLRSTVGSRSSSVVGVARRMKQRPRASAGRQSSSSSSGGRSTMISPSTPAALASSRKRSRAVAVDRIVVAHQHHRRVVVLAPGSRAPARSVLGERHAGLQRAQAAGLDRRAVGHRVGERHADLDQVGAGGGRPRSSSNDVSGSGSPAQRKVTSPARPSWRERREARLDPAAHSVTPSRVRPP